MGIPPPPSPFTIRRAACTALLAVAVAPWRRSSSGGVVVLVSAFTTSSSSPLALLVHRTSLFGSPSIGTTHPSSSSLPGSFRGMSNNRSSIHPRKMTSTSTSTLASEGLSDIGGRRASDSDGSIIIEKKKIPNWKERIDISIAKSRKIRGSNFVQISTYDHDAMEPRCRTVVFRGFLKGLPYDSVKEALRVGSKGGDGGEDGDGGGSEESSSRYYGDCAMKMITDARSNKVREATTTGNGNKGGNGNNVEMVWWFPKSSEQYRVRGVLRFVGGDGTLVGGGSDDDADASSIDERIKNHLVAERKQVWGNLSDTAREQFYWVHPGAPYHQFSAGGGDEEATTTLPPTGGRDDDGKVLPVPDTFLLMLLYPRTVDYLRLGDNYRQVDEWEEDRGGDDNDRDDDGGHDGNDGAEGGCRWKSMRVTP